MEVPQASETVSKSRHDKRNSQSQLSSGTETKTRTGSNDSESSAHSFAFPTLPVEWSGSPVRMAEPDRRQSRKDEWWKNFLSCCKS
ncbi:hypothetical protein L6164_014472 [Bauhinia variegata]|uniref:Uncharacterized protein n=1 Tax=Bauhinia variegata TaxID=167791 RepID=A0ACB9NJE6_BAUVA|nr:hypothetical protein L6164_014472 [Bauhinia variegata]